MLINLSNHPSANWGDLQKEEAEKLFGLVKDIPFPEILPEIGEEEIQTIAKDYLSRILESQTNSNDVLSVHLMGEYTFVFRLLLLLKKKGIKAFCSTSARHVKINPDNTKTVRFEFVRFREYY